MHATLGSPGNAAAQFIGQASSSANHGALQPGQPEWQCSPSGTLYWHGCVSRLGSGMRIQPLAGPSLTSVAGTWLGLALGLGLGVGVG